jgi:hypothetical protein
MVFKKVNSKTAGFEKMNLIDGTDYIAAILPLNTEGVLSPTCKTLNYASTHGNISTGLLSADNKPLMFGGNCFVSIPKHERQPNPMAAK